MLRTTLLSLTVLLASAPTAAAQEAPQDFPVERFRLATDREGLLDVEWAAVPAHKTWELGFWLGAADDPLAIYRNDDARERLGALVTHRVGGTLIGALALYDRVQVGFELPLILSQDREIIDGVMMDELASVGLGDLRLSPKIRLLRRGDFHLALMASLTLPTGTAASYHGEDGPMFAPELIASRAFGAIRLSTNLGYRARPQAELAGLVIDDELLARIGAGYRLGERGGPPLELDLTVSAATSASDPFSAFNLDALEVVGGASYQINRALQGVAAAGLGIQEGFGTPDWRLVLGVRYQRGGDRDYDGDGLVGAADRCPHEAEDVDGFEDSNGCPDPDNDGDGVPDVADGAPMEAEDKDGYEDGDGVPDPDNDNDGVLDVADACPLEAEDMDGFEDGNGCPDPDNDNDGVLDVADGCPLESGVADNQGCPDTDRDGDTVVDRLDQCPDEPGEVDRNGCAATVEVKGDIIVFGKVHFNTSEAVILPRSHRVLDEAAKAIRERPELGKIQVEGHTDDRGDNFFNRSLSQRRAQAVVDYLVGKGVSRARLIPKGFGPMVPLQPNTSDENRAVNRRVELRIIGN